MSSYASYKDSGVAWIGDIPSHWIKSKFKFVSELQTGNSLNDEQKQVYESDNPEEIPYVSSKDIDVDFKTVNYDNGLRIPRVDNKLRVSPKGSFLLVIEGGSAGRKMVYLDKEVCFVNKLCSFHSRENTKFQYYFVQSNNYQDKFRTSLSGLIGGVSISNLREFELPLPPLPEQQQIVTFLDSKTSQIDELIQKKIRKIELLKEYRISLINHVVTKGLNPNIKMKDSGVEWIGDIPRHWDTTKIKYTTDGNRNSFIDGDWIESKNLSNEGIRYITTGNIGEGYYKEQGNGFISEKTFNELNCTEVFEGDLVISRLSLPVGRSCIIPFIHNKVVTSVDNVILRPTHDFCKEFLNYQFNSKKYFDFTELIARGTTLTRISRGMLGNNPIVKPTLIEQNEIVSYLDEQTEKIDSSIQLEKKKIKLLKEYRQSLISAVVTGKIKVF
jgi:type I restriction enzyme S subunit